MEADLKETMAMVKQFNEDLDNLKKMLEKLGRAPTEEDFQLLRNRVDNMEQGFGGFRKADAELEKKIKALQKKFEKLDDFEGKIDSLDQIL